MRVEVANISDSLKADLQRLADEHQIQRQQQAMADEIWRNLAKDIMDAYKKRIFVDVCREPLCLKFSNNSMNEQRRRVVTYMNGKYSDLMRTDYVTFPGSAYDHTERGMAISCKKEQLENAIYGLIMDYTSALDAGMK